MFDAALDLPTTSVHPSISPFHRPCPPQRAKAVAQPADPVIQPPTPPLEIDVRRWQGPIITMENRVGEWGDGRDTCGGVLHARVGCDTRDMCGVFLWWIMQV
jgi:hypothetical protein